MLNCSPLIPLFLGVILAIVIVRDSIVKRKFLKYRLSVSFVFIFATNLMICWTQAAFHEEYFFNSGNCFRPKIPSKEKSEVSHYPEQEQNTG